MAEIEDRGAVGVRSVGARQLDASHFARCGGRLPVRGTSGRWGLRRFGPEDVHGIRQVIARTVPDSAPDGQFLEVHQRRRMVEVPAGARCRRRFRTDRPTIGPVIGIRSAVPIADPPRVECRRDGHPKLFGVPVFGAPSADDVHMFERGGPDQGLEDAGARHSIDMADDGALHRPAQDARRPAADTESARDRCPVFVGPGKLCGHARHGTCAKAGASRFPFACDKSPCENHGRERDRDAPAGAVHAGGSAGRDRPPSARMRSSSRSTSRTPAASGAGGRARFRSRTCRRCTSR